MIKIKNKYFNSYPVVFHHNGRPSRFNHPSGKLIKKKVFDYFSDGSGDTFRGRKERVDYPIPKKSSEFNKISDKLTIFMVTNLVEKGSAARSLDYFNLKYKIEGKNIVKYTPFEKYKKLIDFIPTVKTKYMMLFDTDDVFIVDGLGSLVNNFEKEMDCKMLFNAECWNYPKVDQEQTRFEEEVVLFNTPFKYLNSGVWISNVEFLKDKYEELLSLSSYNDDQAIFKRFYKMFYPKVKIDYKCKYFQSLTWSKWFEDKCPGRLDLEVEIL